MNTKETITRAALKPNGTDVSEEGIALNVARAMKNSQSASKATLLALTWGGLSREQAKAEGFRFVTSVMDDINFAEAQQRAKAKAWFESFAPKATGPVGSHQIVFGTAGVTEEENKAKAAKEGPFVLIFVGGRKGVEVVLQTAEGLADIGSLCAAKHDPKGFLQAAAENARVLARLHLGALLAEEGIEIEEFLEDQEDARYADAAMRGVEINPATGKYPWE